MYATRTINYTRRYVYYDLRRSGAQWRVERIFGMPCTPNGFCVGGWTEGGRGTKGEYGCTVGVIFLGASQNVWGRWIFVFFILLVNKIDNEFIFERGAGRQKDPLSPLYRPSKIAGWWKKFWWLFDYYGYILLGVYIKTDREDGGFFLEGRGKLSTKTIRFNVWWCRIIVRILHKVQYQIF